MLKASLTISLVEKKPVSRDTSSSKWDVVDSKLNTLPLQCFLIIAMSINDETSVIINETTTIKLIELNKKNNYKNLFNVFATAIFPDAVTYRWWSFPYQMPVKSISVHYTLTSIMLKQYNTSSLFRKIRAYFGVDSFNDNFIGREKACKPGY